MDNNFSISEIERRQNYMLCNIFSKENGNTDDCILRKILRKKHRILPKFGFKNETNRADFCRKRKQVCDFTFKLKADFARRLTAANYRPATTITNSPLGVCSVKCATNSARVPCLVSSNFLEISRETEAARSEPSTSANCCSVFTTRNGDS